MDFFILFQVVNSEGEKNEHPVTLYPTRETTRHTWVYPVVSLRRRLEKKEERDLETKTDTESRIGHVGLISKSPRFYKPDIGLR